MADDADPPRKFFQLKPTEFERVNQAPAPAADPAAPATRPSEPSANQRIDVRDLIKIGAGTAPVLGANAVVNRANDVHAMLKQNLAADDAAGLNQVAPRPKRRSRRKRDFWLLLIPVNLFFGYMAISGGNAVAFVYGIGGIALFTSGLTWVMWFVMDDY
jgi:hypothetical protein